MFYNFLLAFTESCDKSRKSGPNKESSEPESIWREYTDHTSKVCQDKQHTENNTLSNDESPCSYAFMVNRMTSVADAADVNRKMNEVLVTNVGWKAEGNLVKQPRAGWYAKEAGAHFSVKIDAAFDTKFVTVMIMKSYGPNFLDTRLEIDFRMPFGVNVTHDITGYHETKTSIHVPQKFELPNGGITKGESLLVEFRLVSGSYFKIAGLAFCRF